jgi:hypothetical protein
LLHKAKTSYILKRREYVYNTAKDNCKESSLQILDGRRQIIYFLTKTNDEYNDRHNESPLRSNSHCHLPPLLSWKSYFFSGFWKSRWEVLYLAKSGVSLSRRTPRTLLGWAHLIVFQRVRHIMGRSVGCGSGTFFCSAYILLKI